MKRRLARRLDALFSSPLLRRIGYHVRRLTSGMERGFFLRLVLGLLAVVALATILVTVIEGPHDSVGALLESFGATFYWGVTTVMGSGDASYVHTPGGYVISWLLVLFGVAIVASITGALVGFVIDFILKEGQGMGAAGYRDHIVVCGWNSTARDLVAELEGDEYEHRIVVIHDSDKNPAGRGVYFVNGDVTNAEDLRRAGIEEASAAVVCPADGSNEADMRSILCVMAVEAIAPQVRTVVEVNNPQHVDHFRRANADEIMVTSRIASRLLARSSLYPGLAEVVTDIVSGGEGSELYRVELPAAFVGLSVDELSARLRADHSATLLAIGRDGHTHVNPSTDFRLCAGDDAVVVAESLGTLAPLEVSTTE
ncbi:MAG: potassium channel protein [Marmoricola sp.]|nr:potassium channel protein [Marmoricola sp.]